MELFALAMKLAPWLINMISGGAAGPTLAKISDIAKQVFGTTDAAEIELKIQEDRGLTERFRASLEAQRSEFDAILADVQSARSMTASLIGAGSLAGWGAPVVSVLVTIGFFSMLVIIMRGWTMTPGTDQVANLLFGTMAAGFVQVLNFWLGSSQGSKNKDFALANSVPVTAMPAAQGVPGLASVPAPEPAQPRRRRPALGRA